MGTLTDPTTTNNRAPEANVRSLPHVAALVAFAAATVFLIPLKLFVPGVASWLVTLALIVASGDRVLRRNMSVLLVCIAVLAAAPIHTELSTRHFIGIGIPFFVVTAGPFLFMRWRAPGEVVWRFWPREFSLRDLIYTIISIPLAWGIIWVYFFHLTPEMPTQWPMPAEHDMGMVRRLVIGINCVGIWDELFFVNTVYLLLRRLYPAWLANLGQSVVYTSVLYTMAFVGAGPAIVYFFALTQGVMYEKSRVLLYVLLVHLIVDAFLVFAILQYYYPGSSLTVF